MNAVHDDWKQRMAERSPKDEPSNIRPRIRTRIEPEKGKRLADPTFRYVPSAETDLRKTFAKVRKALQREVKTEQQAAQELDKKLINFKR